MPKTMQKRRSITIVLVNEFEVRDEAVRLNLAHAHFYLEQEQMKENQRPQGADNQALKPFEVAKKYYSELSLSQNKKISSTAYNQLGIIEGANAMDAKAANSALDHFREALKQNPNNDLARYNYEVMIRQQGQNQSQSNKENNESEEENGGDGGGEEDKQNDQNQQNEDDKDSEQQEGRQPQEEQTDEDKDSRESRNAMLRAIDRKPIEYQRMQRFKPRNKNKKSKNW